MDNSLMILVPRAGIEPARRYSQPRILSPKQCLLKTLCFQKTLIIPLVCSFFLFCRNSEKTSIPQCSISRASAKIYRSALGNIPGGCLMSDVVKCRGVDCPLKLHCWRFLAPSGAERGSWVLNLSPDEDGKCEHFWSIDPEPEAA